jgi:hypothetical protein
MNCCDEDDRSAREVTLTPTDSLASISKSRSRRVMAFFQWMLPITTLALIPKCPMCVAAYVLLFTGVGLSLPAAAAVRWIVMGLGVAALAYLSLRTARRFRARMTASV